MSRVIPKKQSRHRPRYLDKIRKEAFDLYCTGLSRRRVAAALQEKYGQEQAPHPETVKRWMSQDRWTKRRRVIRERAMELEDRQRILEGMRMLQGLEELPFKTKGEAMRSIVQGQKVVKDLLAEVEGPLTMEDMDAIIEHFFRVLYADEEVGPVLAKRRYLIEAALEEARYDLPPGKSRLE